MESSEIKFLTTSGELSLDEIDRSKGTHWNISYFDESILKNYEDNEDYLISDDGHHISITDINYKWGTGRTLSRVNKGILLSMIGDLVKEGMPEEHIRLWAEKNLDPKDVTVPEYYHDFRRDIRRMLHFMGEINNYVKNLLKRVYLTEIEDDRLFNIDNLDKELAFLKKFTPKNISRADFQSRIVFLNIIVAENINTNLMKAIMKEIDVSMLYSPEDLALQELIDLNEKVNPELTKLVKRKKRPLPSLGMLMKFILFLRINHAIISSKKISSIKELEEKRMEIKVKVKEEFEKFNKFKVENVDFENKKFFIQEENLIIENTKHLKLLNKLRSSASAHGYSETALKEVLKKFNLPEDSLDLNEAYNEIINKVGRDVEKILFHLMPAHNPFIENYREFIPKCLEELSKNKERYESDFEELFSYFNEFPQLIEEFEEDFYKLFEKQKQNDSFIIWLGYYIEHLSRINFMKAQEYVDMVLEKMRMKGERKFALAHLINTIKNSDELSDEFFDKVYPQILEHLKNQDKDLRWVSEWGIWALLENFSERVDVNSLGIEKKEILFDPLKKYF